MGKGGIDSDHHRRTQQNTWYYEMTDLGFNYRMSDFQCALGISQLKKLPLFLKMRQEIAAQYNQIFEKLQGVQPLLAGDHVSHAYHLRKVERRSAVL